LRKAQQKTRLQIATTAVLVVFVVVRQLHVIKIRYKVRI